MINNIKIYKHLYAVYGSLYSENNYFDVTVQFSQSLSHVRLFANEP